MKTLSHYATTVENGKIISHEDDERYAVYVEDIKAIHEESEKWHKWVVEHYPNAYDSLGSLLNNPNYGKMRVEYLNALKEELK